VGASFHRLRSRRRRKRSAIFGGGGSLRNWLYVVRRRLPMALATPRASTRCFRSRIRFPSGLGVSLIGGLWDTFSVLSITGSEDCSPAAGTIFPVTRENYIDRVHNKDERPFQSTGRLTFAFGGHITNTYDYSPPPVAIQCHSASLAAGPQRSQRSPTTTQACCIDYESLAAARHGQSDSGCKVDAALCHRLGHLGDWRR
jgi:hypothetical protein